MNKILELREKRAKAWETAKAFLDTKRGADGIVSAEDTAVYDKMEADVVALGHEIDRLERHPDSRESFEPVSGFTVLFTALLIAEIKIMTIQISLGFNGGH